jgi:hypothetical protein
MAFSSGSDRSIRGLLAGALIISGCGDDTTRSVTIDTGTVCVRSGADGALSVSILFPDCTSSSCDTVRERTCTVSQVGDKIIVHSRAIIDRESGSCTTDCGIVTADCRSAPIDPGDFTIVHGSDSQSMTLPLESRIVLGNAGALGGCH